MKKGKLAILAAALVFCAGITFGTKMVHAETTGTYGENGAGTWVLSDDGTLTISGNDSMSFMDFYGIEPVKVVIQDGLKTIGSGAFKNHTSIASVSIPGSVEYIGKHAFTDCANLSEVILSDGLTHIGLQAFQGDANLKQIDFPKSIRIIDGYSFEGCGFTEIVIPEGAKTYIRRGAFGKCPNLVRVDLPESMTKLDPEAFAESDALKDIYYGGTEESWYELFTDGKYIDDPNITIHFLKKSENISLTKASVEVKESDPHALVYTGKAITPSPIVYVGDKELKNGTDYTVAYKNNKNAGTAKVIVTGKGKYTDSAETTFTISKAVNPMTAKGNTIKVKASVLSKKAQTFAAKKAFTIKKAAGKVTYKKKSGNKAITVSGAGKITVKKGLKKGTYSVKVNVTAAGNANYKKATKTVTFKVKVQ